MVGDDHAVADLVLPDPFADLGDLARDLVAENARGLLYPIPFHHVAAADAAGLDANEQLARTDFGRRLLLKADIAVAVIHGDAHGLFFLQKTVMRDP
jgi:hypothetical protein